MLFTEPTFLFLFLPVLLGLYFVTLSRSHASYANWLLLAASIVFYAKGGGAFTWLMLASIADDALTAKDRPYKKAMPVERALDILASDVKGGKLDAELFEVFVQARVWALTSTDSPPRN